MISQTNGSVVRNAYSGSVGESKDSKGLKTLTVSQQGDASRVEQIKDALDSGEYKVDLDALSELIATELLQ